LLIRGTAMQTPDLLLVGAGILMIIFVLTWFMGRLGLYRETHLSLKPEAAAGGWQALRHSRYLLLIAAVLLVAQAASPLVEFQFLKSVEAAYPVMDARTAFLSMFFSLLGLVSIGVNLGLTPLIHRYLGVIAGLLAQPLMMGLCSGGFWAFPTLFTAAATKISDRGLSYSINRASKELLYVPLNPVLIYQAKAWIDMFGYRLFKVFGSLLILLCTRWLPTHWEVPRLSWVTLGLCGIWIAMILVLRQDYRWMAEKPLEEWERY
jgi:AAA family ATP:ADP antiporter